jgi:hypothetical protein
MSDTILNIPEGKAAQFQLAGNVYCGKKGIRLGNKLLPPGTSTGGKNDINCIWSDEFPSGRFNAEIKKYKRLKGFLGVERSCGARLPDSVWAKYEKYRKAKTSVDGLSFSDK